MTPDRQKIEAALNWVDREIWIVTAAAGGRQGGLVATWVSEASIDRENPVLLAGIAPNHFTAELIAGSAAFAAHLLNSDQTQLAMNFAIGSGRDRDKLAGITTRTESTGSPILRDCLAWFDCRVFARYDAGDRIYFWADVLAAESCGAGPPLRQQTFFREASDEQRQELIANRDADIEIQRPLYRAWRTGLSSS